jgi:hypothetical protein
MRRPVYLVKNGTDLKDNVGREFMCRIARSRRVSLLNDGRSLFRTCLFILGQYFACSALETVDSRFKIAEITRAKFVYQYYDERAVRAKRARWPPEMQVELWCKRKKIGAM